MNLLVPNIVIDPKVSLAALKSSHGSSFRLISQIVTWNEKDFLQAKSFGIKVTTPRDFLLTLEH